MHRALSADLALEADVAIVGTGAGGGTAAEILSAAGLSRGHDRGRTACDVLRLSHARARGLSAALPGIRRAQDPRQGDQHPAGTLRRRRHDGQLDDRAFARRATTLTHWARTFGIAGFAEADLAPWFERVETPANIAPWEVAPNENNDVLRRGAKRSASRRRRSGATSKAAGTSATAASAARPTPSSRCWSRRFPRRLSNGATLLTRARALDIRSFAADSVTALNCVGLDARGDRSGPAPHRRARPHFVAAGGAIGTPALLLRSRAPDPHGIVGKRTFLHPTVVSAALMPHRVDGYAGAPQTVYSDHFLDSAADRRPDRLQARSAAAASGAGRHDAVRRRRGARALDARAPAHAGRDRADARRLSSGKRRRHRVACRATARRCSTIRSTTISGMAHDARSRRWPRSSSPRARRRSCRFTPQARATRTGAQAQAAIAALPLEPLAAAVVSAHVMGGCPLGPDPRRAVTDPTAAIIIWTTSTYSTARCSRPASAPIHSFRSTGSWPSSRSALAQRLAPTRTALHD